MPKFLLDANLSYETKKFIEDYCGYETITVREVGLQRAQDKTIASFAVQQNYVIVTLDLDYGEIYYFGTPNKIGVIVLRLKDQRVETVNQVLEKFLRQGVVEKYPFGLMIVNENRFRVRFKPKGVKRLIKTPLNFSG